jgi:hypothetical protein
MHWGCHLHASYRRTSIVATATTAVRASLQSDLARRRRPVAPIHDVRDASVRVANSDADAADEPSSIDSSAGPSLLMDMESVASDGDELTLRMALRPACSTDDTLECRARGVGDAKPGSDDSGDDTALHQQPATDAPERRTTKHGHSLSPLWLRS